MPSGVAISSRSTEPAQPGSSQRRAPAAGATPVGARRVTGLPHVYEGAEEVGDVGGGGTWARDEDRAGAAVGLEVVDPCLGGVPGGGADAGACLGSAAEQASAVGLREGLGGV